MYSHECTNIHTYLYIHTYIFGYSQANFQMLVGYTIYMEENGLTGGWKHWIGRYYVSVGKVHLEIIKLAPKYSLNEEVASKKSLNMISLLHR